MNIHEIFKWQTLIGALIGAGTPLTFWFFTTWYQKRQNYRNDLVLLEKLLVYNLNTALNNETTILHFIKTKLLPLLNQIEDRKQKGIYSTDVAYFPLFPTPSDEGLLTIKLKSNYLANKVMQVASMSKSLSFAIKDIREQFKDVIQINKEIGILKLNPPALHNQQYQENVTEFKKILEDEMLGNNIKLYIKTLLSAMIPLQEYLKIGNFKWERKFSHKFRYFKNKKELMAFRDGGSERMETYFKPKVDARIVEIGSPEINPV